jgi:hypothetical protein
MCTQVVLGDDRLRHERHDLLAQVDPGPDPVDERNHRVQAGVQRPAVRTQPLDHIGAGLRHDADRAAHPGHQHRGGHGDHDYHGHVGSFSA